jgi:hypothetical protein
MRCQQQTPGHQQSRMVITSEKFKCAIDEMCEARGYICSGGVVDRLPATRNSTAKMTMMRLQEAMLYREAGTCGQQSYLSRGRSNSRRSGKIKREARLRADLNTSNLGTKQPNYIPISMVCIPYVLSSGNNNRTLDGKRPKGVSHSSATVDDLAELVLRK